MVKSKLKSAPENKPNIIYSSFARSGASAIDVILNSLLTSIGYYVPPFGIKASPSICTKVAGIRDPFYHFTHAPPQMFEPLLEQPDYRFIYQYRDPRDSVISWAYNEISEGNVKGNVDLETVLKQIILSRYHLTEHISRARDWFSLGNKVFCVSFEAMKENKERVIKNIVRFLGISQLIDVNAINSAVSENSDMQYAGSLNVKEARLYKLKLVRCERGVSRAWVNGLTPVNKLLFKKIAGDYLIELGYEKDFNW